MIFKSRSVALIISLFVGILTNVSLSFVPGLDALPYLFAFCGAFVSTYIICYLIFEFIIFKELRRFYNHIGQSDNTGPDALDSMNLIKMSSQLFRFAEKKEAEIIKLKKVEAFRREFLADISHELKTPLFAAQGMVETLIDGAIDDKKVRNKFLKKASKSLDQLDNIVKDLITISHLETGELKLEFDDYDLVEIVQEYIDQFEQKAQKKETNLQFEVKSTSSRLLTKVDRYRIGQVFQNLIGNGINYAGLGATVTVRLIDESDYINVVVSDNGIGIEKEHLDKIFQRFYRVDKSRSREKGGTGLGLSIVKYIVEAHDSKVKVESELNKGTTFFFKLKKA